ncbi:MAG: CRISPR-associated protein [Blastocatellia bacterium]
MRKRSYSSAWQLLFSPDAIIPFLLGSLMMAVAGNAIYELLTNLLGTSNKAIVGIGISALMVLGGAVVALKHFAKQFQTTPTLIGKKPPDPRKGLILLVSEEETCRKAIDWHRDRLAHCWLLYSTKSKSQDTAERLRQELAGTGVRAEMIFISGVYDPLEFKQKVDSIYAALPEGFVESDVILDFTGMTGCASVGSVIACLDEQRPKQYTPGHYDAKLDVTQPLDPVEIVLHWGLLRSPALVESAKTAEISNVAQKQGAEVE